MNPGDDPTVQPDPTASAVVADGTDPTTVVLTPEQEERKKKLEDPEVLLAIANAKNESYEKALAAKPDPIATRVETPQIPQMQAPPPNWQGMLTQEQRKQYDEALVLQPAQASAFAADMQSKHAAWNLQYQAAGVMGVNANLIVESFITRMSRRDAKLADQIEPLFRSEMSRAGDIRPLVNMSEGQRDSELLLRWNSAKSQVQDKIMSNPPKPEPRLVAPGSSVATPPRQANVAVDDPLIAQMHGHYKFTPEQLRELQEMA